MPKNAIASKKKANNKDEYGAEQITVLEGLDPVRKRPGMYIGNTAEEGLHHLIWEIVNNSIDEAMAGFCSDIIIKLLPGNAVQVIDNGRGIPVEIHKTTKVSALETVMTKLHAGGKFGQGGYKVSGGLHGVGVSVVNALSSLTKATIKRDGNIYEQEYKIGIPKSKTKLIGKYRRPSKHDPLAPEKSFATGTTIEFLPDTSIFTVTEFNWDKVLTYLRQQAYLTKGIRISAIDLRDKAEPKHYSFFFEGGISSYVKHLNRKEKPITHTTFYVDKTVDDVQVELAIRYIEDYNETVIAFTNNIVNPEGGMHIAGFRTGLTRTLNSYARKNNILKEKDENLTGDDVREGLVCIISIKVKDPQFEGQTKAKLGNAEVKPAVDSITSKYLEIFLEEHPKEAEAIISKSLLASQARKASKAARETVLRKGVLESLSLPGKLADCSSRDPEDCELYIVEGDSAGGSAKQGRDRNTQAILPLRGKIINIEKARIDKMLANNEVKSLIIALGTNFGEQMNIENLRYGKVIIMTDADVDGAHIRTLLLTLFFRYFTDLITHGNLYIAQPPLYSVKKGKVVKWVYSDNELKTILDEMKKLKVEAPKKKEEPEEELEVGADPVEEKEEEKMDLGDGIDMNDESLKGISIQRYKGLGEMNPDQLWHTTMDPTTRVLLKVTNEDAAKADETFSILMGSDVIPRKKFIQTHAKYVKNLDV